MSLFIEYEAGYTTWRMNEPENGGVAEGGGTRQPGGGVFVTDSNEMRQNFR